MVPHGGSVAITPASASALRSSRTAWCVEPRERRREEVTEWPST